MVPRSNLPLTRMPCPTLAPPAGAKLFYLSGMKNGKYLKREVHNLGEWTRAGYKQSDGGTRASEGGGT